ncbi:MAG: AgmX/PglI C-terminal domain-containing protein [Pseudomonadota bacterium]
MADPSGYRRGLPWTPEKGENGRFALILFSAFLLFLPPAIIIPLLQVPEPERSESEKVPPRLARLVEQRQPPEPVQAPEPEPRKKPEPEKTPEKNEPDPVVRAPEPTQLKPQPEPEVESAAEPDREATERARETASRSGLLAMKEQLSALRASEPESQPALAANIADDGGEAPAVDDNRAEAMRGSGGVSADKAPTRDVEVQNHQVREVAVTPDPEPVRVAESEKSGPPERGMTNIRKVFDAQKTALYSIYRRELRQDPTLEGKVLLELVIEPDGSVSSCEVVNSELDNPELENRIATRVRLFNFGEADVAARKVKFPIDFLPG